LNKTQKHFTLNNISDTHHSLSVTFKTIRDSLCSWYIWDPFEI